VGSHLTQVITYLSYRVGLDAQESLLQTVQHESGRFSALNDLLRSAFLSVDRPLGFSEIVTIVGLFAISALCRFFLPIACYVVR
jgi:hypothetical protein